jgi:threonine/homoserine/homoserine lactone efflux protein
MLISTWFAFLFAAGIILIIPGPTIILVISLALSHGRRSVIPLVAGVVCGDLTAMTISLTGLGAILAASANLFTVFKWLGALYLIYLGIRLWRSKAAAGELAAGENRASAGALFRSSYIVTALNPKSIAFFVAFFPQFIRADQSAAPQFLLLGTTFLLLAVVNAALYALFAGHLRDVISDSAICRWLNRCGGGALVGAGIFTAGMHYSS